MTELRPFQRAGVRLIHDHDGRALLGDEQGLGKTIQSLVYCWKYLPNDPPGPIVVVCPPHLRIHWQRQAKEHVGWHAEVLSGEKVPVGRQPPTDPNGVLVISYNILEQPRREGKRADADQSWWRWLVNLHPRCIVGDEIHAIKEATSARYRAFRRLCRDVPRLVFLSGTPAINNAIELFNPVNILWPDEFPSRFDYGQQYTHARLNMWGRWEYHGGKNLHELHAKLTRCGMIRRLKRDVLPQLPRITVTVIPVELDRAGRKEYDMAAADFLTWLEKISPTLARRAERAEGLTRIGYLRRLAARLKFKSVVGWTDDFLAGGGKLLAGAVHKSVVRPLAEAFPGRSVIVDGDLGHRDKQLAFDRFNLDPQCVLCVGNVQAAGTGWSCTSTSDVMMYELPWTPGELAQFIARIHGIERGLPDVAANVTLLVAQGTIEEDQCEMLQTKQSILDAALDGGPVDESMNVFDELKRRTRERAERRAEYAAHVARAEQIRG